MKVQQLILLFVVLLMVTFSCSTGPDFERDNFHDPKTKIPNAIFIHPKPNIDKNYRGAHEFNSFTILVNAAVINQDVTLTLVSDKDGELFSTNNIASDTLKIDYTLLSRNEHEITLFLNEVKTDQVISKVNLPDQVRLFEPTWDTLGYKIKWSSYPESDFEKYTVNVLKSDGSIEILKESHNINDTVFVDYNYPIEHSFEYFISTYSEIYLGKNASSKRTVKPNFMLQSDEHNLFNEYYIAGNLIKHTDGISLYYITRRRDGVYIINGYNTSTNKIMKKPIEGIDKANKIYAYNDFSGPKIFISVGNYLHQVDPIDFSILSSHDLSSKAFINQETTQSPVTDIIYDKQSKSYFIIFGTSYPHGPYSFDQKFNYLNNYEVENIHTFLGIKDNILLAKNSWSPNTIYSYSFNENGLIKEKTNNAYRVSSTNKFSTISKKNNRIFFGGHGYIFSADLDLNYLGLLPDIDGYYTDYAIDVSNQDILLASSSDGRLYKIYIPDNQIISIQRYKYKIIKIFIINENKYLLQSDGDRLEPIYKLTYVP